MKWHVSHPQDLKDATDRLRDIPYSYVLMATPVKPEKGTDEYEKWLRLNSLFHRGVVPTYSELSGLGEDESKQDLQIRFACVREHLDHYEVESVGDMSVKRLNEFIDNCQNFLIMNFGARADELLIINSKTKKIKK